MPYFSTRSHECVTASQAILKGLSNSGGLYCPVLFPQLDNDFIKKLCSMNYLERAAEILFLLLDDYEKSEIIDIVNQAYNESKFDDSRIAPLKELNAQTYMLELHHGPTAAFKDMALQVLPHLLKYATNKNKEDRSIEILVATSGDTGKAALEGFKNIEGIGCTVFYPEDGVSDIQKLQMVTSEGRNVRVIGIYGNFDDTQTGVKNIFNNVDLNKRLNEKGYILSSANSINLGRLLPQVVYYISAYADLLNMEKIKLGDKINFVVPTGNFGNILAAYYAKKMGLPIKKLICASNANNILT
ncbi:MAG: threonine synthase, partial [Christensenellaceae bacterium]|nr:threonine synthase [Christensenellaceae bacterium]